MKAAVGIDIGYGQSKLAHATQEGIRSQIFPSGAGPIGLFPRYPNGDVDICGGIKVTVNNEPWVACVDQTMIQDYVRDNSACFPRTAEWTALFHALLLRAGHERISTLVVGLPVSEAFAPAGTHWLQSRIEGTHLVANGVRITVERAVVVPQPAGTFASFLGNQARARGVRISAHDLLAVVDIGHYSFDWVLMRGASIRHVASNSSYYAGRAVATEAARQVEKSVGRSVSWERIDAARRTGQKTLQLGNKTVSIEPFIVGAVNTVVRNAISAFRSSLGEEARDLNAVILAGGGAVDSEAAFRAAFPTVDVHVVDDPVSSNALGFLHLAREIALRAA